MCCNLLKQAALKLKRSRPGPAGWDLPGRTLASLVLLLAFAPSPVHAQSGNPIYSRQSVFRIPFEVDASERRLRDVELYVSDDQGQNWRKAATASPEQRGFNYRAERDGLFWFAVRTVDIGGRATPASIQSLRPQLRVVIDTQTPIVTVRPKPNRDAGFGISWDVRDENLDLSTLAVEYRLPAGADWIPLRVDPAAVGERSWDPGTNGAIEVRVRVQDYAKNEGVARLTLTPGSQDYRQSSNPQERRGSDAGIAPGTRWVNSKRISLSYEIVDKGPSGVSTVEVWATRDGRSWKKYREDQSHQSPYVFDVEGEGLYGFTLVVRSGVGLYARPPQPGDQPDVWVDVDLTKPIVHWVNVDVGQGIDSGKLTITWKASDKNFGREPVTLYYAKTASGPWTQIASNVENTGRYIWQMPPGVPYSFFVRVEANDKAGNTGFSDTTKPVLVDLIKPRGKIVGVEPVRGDKSGGSSSPTSSDDP